jgi:hypothetical protein
MVTLLFAAVIGWLGVRLLQQDRDLARQRRREQLEAVADRVGGALYRRLRNWKTCWQARREPHSRPGQCCCKETATIWR